MPDRPVCPYCKSRLFPHEVTNDQCTSCGCRLSAAVGRPAPPEAEAAPRFDRPLTLPDRPPPEAFAAVRHGVNLVRWGVLSGFAFTALSAAGQLAEANLPGPGLQWAARTLWLFGGVFQFGSAAVVALGVCFGCVVPKGCGARKWARGVALSFIIGGILLLGLIVAAADFSPGTGGPLPTPGAPATVFIILVLGIVGVFASLCYFLLLAALARFLGDEGLSRSLTTYYFFALLISAVSVLGILVALVVDAGPAPSSPAAVFVSAGEIVLCGGLAIDAVLSVWLLGLLTRLHRLIPSPDEPEPPRGFPPPGRWD